MAIDELADLSASNTTRRTIVKTGIKLAYAAPIVAVSMKLNEAAAQDCAVGQDSCNGTDYPCGDSGNCYCSSDTEGRTFCAQFTGGFCDSYQKCQISGDCPDGQRCAPGPDCCGGICLAPCAGSVSAPRVDAQVTGARSGRGAPPFA